MTQTQKSIDTFFGVKAGMTRIFDENGNHVPVTVVKIIKNVISQVKTSEKEGYTAYQVAYSEKRESLALSPQKGHLSKAGISSNLTKFSEIKVPNVSVDDLGAELSLNSFSIGDFIDVSAVSKGKGFAGVLKRYNFRGGPATHGSHFHRRVGSIGNRATPGRVFKNKKMPGHMGCELTKIQNLKLVEINTNNGYILIKGSVPGGKNGILRISKSVKK